MAALSNFSIERIVGNGSNGTRSQATNNTRNLAAMATSSILQPNQVNAHVNNNWMGVGSTSGQGGSGTRPVWRTWQSNMAGPSGLATSVGLTLPAHSGTGSSTAVPPATGSQQPQGTSLRPLLSFLPLSTSNSGSQGPGGQGTALLMYSAVVAGQKRPSEGESSRAKQCRYMDQEPGTSSVEEDTVDEPFDPEEYYSAAERKAPKENRQKRFWKCIDKEKRRRCLIITQFQTLQQPIHPKPMMTSLCTLGRVSHRSQMIVSGGFRLPSLQQHAGPHTKLWCELLEQKLAPSSGGLVPVDVVLDTVQKLVATIGNSTNYVSQVRRDVIISNIEARKQGLAQILQKACSLTWRMHRSSLALPSGKL